MVNIQMAIIQILKFKLDYYKFDLQNLFYQKYNLILPLALAENKTKLIYFMKYFTLFRLGIHQISLFLIYKYHYHLP